MEEAQAQAVYDFVDFFRWCRLYKNFQILLKVSLSDVAECVGFSMDNGLSLIAVNASPISEGHILLLPLPEACLNQVYISNIYLVLNHS